jgi:hypothetical protein
MGDRNDLSNPLNIAYRIMEFRKEKKYKESDVLVGDLKDLGYKVEFNKNNTKLIGAKTYIIN